jgi:hypothetical protein
VSKRPRTGARNENYFVLTPLLFGACSGTLKLRHCAQRMCPALRYTRFVEATVEKIKVNRRVVRATAAGGITYEIALPVAPSSGRFSVRGLRRPRLPLPRHD